MDRGAWRATGPGGTKSQTDLSIYAHRVQYYITDCVSGYLGLLCRTNERALALEPIHRWGNDCTDTQPIGSVPLERTFVPLSFWRGTLTQVLSALLPLRKGMQRANTLAGSWNSNRSLEQQRRQLQPASHG